MDRKFVPRPFPPALQILAEQHSWPMVTFPSLNLSRLISGFLVTADLTNSDLKGNSVSQIPHHRTTLTRQQCTVWGIEKEGSHTVLIASL